MRKSREPHLIAAASWLSESQKHTPDDGYSGFYSLETGWSASYPETTGYIIPTMVSLGDFLGRQSIESAVHAADWLVEIQTPAGWYQSGLIGEPVTPSVFNTGQAVFGLLSAYYVTKADRFRASALRALNWIVSMQDDDGNWRRGLSSKGSGEFHLYKTRVALAMLQSAKALDCNQYVQPALRNLRFACAYQNDWGWFDCSDVHQNRNGEPLLHFIAYTVEGILEGGILLGDSQLIAVAQKTADELLGLQEPGGSLAGRFDEHWTPTVGWSCLTGVAQAALLWLRLYQLFSAGKYLDAAVRAIDFLCDTQNIGPAAVGVYGGIAGSHPLNGGYAPGKYLSWAAKFFVDAVLTERALKSTL